MRSALSDGSGCSTRTTTQHMDRHVSQVVPSRGEYLRRNKETFAGVCMHSKLSSRKAICELQDRHPAAMTDMNHSYDEDIARCESSCADA